MRNKIVRTMIAAGLCTTLTAAVCGCGFPSVFNNGKNQVANQNSDDSDESDDDKDDSSEDGNNYGFTTFTDGIGDVDNALMPSADELEIGTTEGPDYVIGTGRRDYYVYDEIKYGVDELSIYAASGDYIYIVSEGYEPLREALEEFKAQQILNIEDAYNNFSDLYEIDSSLENMECYDSYSAIVYRDDSEVFSFISDYSAYLGGAHPGEIQTGISYDTQTGEILSLKDYVTDTDMVCENTIEILSRMNQDDFGGEFFEGWEDTVRNEFAEETVCWVATDEGVMIWFNEYDIAPYADGAFYLDFNIEDYPELFAQEYYPVGIALGHEEIDVTAIETQLLAETGEQFTEGIDVLTFEDCKELVENSTYYQTMCDVGIDVNYNCNYPAEYLEDAYVIIKDKTRAGAHNDMVLICNFYPEMNEDSEYLYSSLQYFGVDFGFFIYDKNGAGEDIVYKIIVYDAQPDIMFDNAQDLLKAFFTFYETADY